MNVSPPPILTTLPARNRFKDLARASWILPIIGLGLNFFLVVSSGGKSNISSTLISVVFIGGGFVMGISALFGIKRYGAKGILIPSLIGIGIPIALVILALPSFYTARTHRYGVPPPEAAVHASSAQLLKDEKLRFSMDIPQGFKSWPVGSQTNLEHCFARDLPGAEDARLVISVQRMNGILPQNESLRPEDAAQLTPPNVKLNLVQKNWRGFKVDTFVSEVTQNGVRLTVYCIQIPLLPSAIQINVGGPSSHRLELETLANEIVASVDGKTNWR